MFRVWHVLADDISFHVSPFEIDKHEWTRQFVVRDFIKNGLRYTQWTIAAVHVLFIDFFRWCVVCTTFSIPMTTSSIQWPLGVLVRPTPLTDIGDTSKGTCGLCRIQLFGECSKMAIFNEGGFPCCKWNHHRALITQKQNLEAWRTSLMVWRFVNSPFVYIPSNAFWPKKAAARFLLFTRMRGFAISNPTLLLDEFSSSSSSLIIKNKGKKKSFLKMGLRFLS